MHQGHPPHVSDLYQDETTGLWHVSRYADAAAILKSPYACADDLHTQKLQDLSKRTGRDLGGLMRVLSWFVFQNEDETHKQIRQGITTAASGVLMPDKAQLHDLSEGLIHRLQADVDLDAVTDIAEPFFNAQLTQMLGVPDEDVQYARVLFRDLIAIPFSMQRLGWFEERNEAAHAVWKRLNAIEHQKAALDMPDGVSLVHVVASLSFAQEAVIAMAARMLIHLGQDQKMQSDLRRNPQKLGDFVHETLRLLTSFRFIWRVVRGGDLVVRDKQFAPGTRFQIDLLALNLDMSADRGLKDFDPDPPRSPHVSFALGQHKCMGLRNTYMSVEALLASVLNRFEIKPSSQPVTYGRVAAIERPESAPIVLHKRSSDTAFPKEEPHP